MSNQTVIRDNEIRIKDLNDAIEILNGQMETLKAERSKLVSESYQLSRQIKADKKAKNALKFTNAQQLLVNKMRKGWNLEYGYGKSGRAYGPKPTFYHETVLKVTIDHLVAQGIIVAEPTGFLTNYVLTEKGQTCELPFFSKE